NIEGVHGILTHLDDTTGTILLDDELQGCAFPGPITGGVLSDVQLDGSGRAILERDRIEPPGFEPAGGRGEPLDDLAAFLLDARDDVSLEGPRISHQFERIRCLGASRLDDDDTPGRYRGGRHGVAAGPQVGHDACGTSKGGD